jgi:S-DNA-T family DNA segregation ATPase FtsK/SpoIIIE
MAHDRTDTAHAKAVDGLEDAEFFEPEEPFTEAEATEAALTDIEATDLDLGYLALYADELHSAAEPVTRSTSVAAQALIPVAPVQAADSDEMVKPGAPIETALAHSADLLIDSPTSEANQKGEVEQPLFVDNSIEKDSSFDTEIHSTLMGSGLSAVADMDETFMDVEADLEKQHGPYTEIDAQVEDLLPSAEIIVLPRPVAHREVTPAYELLDIEYLAEVPEREGEILTEDILEEAAGRLEKVIRDFGVKGEVIHVHPGPVVTLYEFEPAPGIKSSRVIALSEDIARSMSAVSARVAVIPGRNAIGIELPNEVRETVYLRELLATEDFETSKHKLPLCLGKTIGGEPVIADLARMPHLLVAGTTGSGKSVAINTMILSLLYRFTPEQCRLIMVDPKMLELSVYDGIPHLLTPVVTDPRKAIIALRWAVREMEDRYRKMSKLGVRNIDGFNARIAEAKAKGEIITRTVQAGFDKATGELA